jgi:WD40 repeat protein
MNRSRGIFFRAYVVISLLVSGCASGPTKAVKAIEPTAGPSLSIPISPRPILYFSQENREFVIKAVNPDGSALGTIVQGQLAGWSREGDRFVFLATDKANGADVVYVSGLDGRPRTIFRAGPGESVFLDGWQSVWSPDSKRIALLVAQASGETFALAILDVDNKEVTKRFEIPVSAHTRGGGPMNWPPYNLKWSPDGGKILLAWEQTIVFDAEKGMLETIAATPVMAEWTAGSDGVYYFDSSFAGGNLVLKRIGRQGVEKVLSRSRLADWGMVNPVLVHTPLIKLSPDGSRLAMASGDGKSGCTILTFDVEAKRSGGLGSPVNRLRVEGAVVAMEWGPDPQGLAILAASQDGLTLRVLDLESGMSTTLAEAGQLKGTQIDIVGLINTISWVP